MKKEINKTELKERINLNYKRLAESDYYKIGEVFSPKDYDWQGDKEGRALLAFVSHYKISGKKIKCMEEMIEKLPDFLNSQGFLGEEKSDVIIEQQLSGHSWLLRGLCEYYEQFGNTFVLETINNIVNNLFLPTKNLYSTYPIDRSENNQGGVSGSEIGLIGNWRLSSDVGCAFMSIDGLSHAYKVTKNNAVKELLDEMIEVYLSIDKVSLCVQTHCTLTAARGMLRLYSLLGDTKYLNGAADIFELYTNNGGMTYTYQNLNWWGRPDTWTEPCAVIDSLMVAVELYKITKSENYRKIAARIYHNGFATLQRNNGGAGTDTVITKESPWDSLKVHMFEAPFCCSMRLAEGLWYVNENIDLLYAELEDKPTKNKNGVYMSGDIIYSLADESLLEYAEEVIEIDGLRLCPIVKYYKVPENLILSTSQKIIF